MNSIIKVKRLVLLACIIVPCIPCYSWAFLQESPFSNLGTNRNEIEEQAKNNNPKAIFLLGQLKPEQRKDLYRKSAELGYAPAMLELARMEEPNQLDRTKAKEEKRALNAGYRNRLNQVFQSLSNHARAGDVDSMYSLGTADGYFAQWGVAKRRECLNWLKKAAELGHPNAPFQYAYELLDSLKFETTPSEKEEGIIWLKKAAVIGDKTYRVSAYTMLAKFYSYGVKEIAMKRDPIAAMDWIKQGAQLEGISPEDFMLTNGLQDPRTIPKAQIKYD